MAQLMNSEDASRLAYVAEAKDLLGELEQALLELETSPHDRDLIDRVFRAMHTIKGSGSMFGFDDVAGFTHELETLFDQVRCGKLSITKPMLDLALRGRDHIVSMFDAFFSAGEVAVEEGAEIIRALRQLMPKQPDEPSSGPAPQAVPDRLAPTEAQLYRVRFKPHQNIFFFGANPVALIEEMCSLGEGRVFVHTEDIPELEECGPDSCYVWWDVVLQSTTSEETIRDVFLFVEDDCELLVQPIGTAHGLTDETAYKRLGEILLERGDVSLEELQKVLKEKKLLGEMLTDAGLVSPERVQAALVEQQVLRQAKEKRQPATAPVEQASSLRVAASKLDYLVDLVGELVIVQAQITQLSGQLQHPSLLPLSEQLEFLSAELRDSTLSIRMLPIGTTFSKFRRLVRDLSSELGKEIELVTEGAETELDKTVIERLNDPLVHLLRNSIDHGIELPHIRLQAGKPAKGVIVLSAEHSGGDVHIRISDDGAGLDVAAIRAKAVERGLISADAELPARDIYALILEPGFSTAKAVTNVSGRGVGMDVVKRTIHELRGHIEIQSERTHGTTILVKLPLTLAIIEGLQICVGDEFYVIPLALVEECVELVRRQITNSKERIINLRGEIVPFIRLREWFEVPGEAPPIEQIVIVGVQGARIGIVVDQVIGEHQTVLKSLGRIYKDVEGISGATIRGDGTMALILDVPRLVQLAIKLQAEPEPLQ